MSLSQPSFSLSPSLPLKSIHTHTHTHIFKKTFPTFHFPQFPSWEWQDLVRWAPVQEEVPHSGADVQSQPAEISYLLEASLALPAQEEETRRPQAREKNCFKGCHSSQENGTWVIPPREGESN